jgi:hypothetical protein
MNGSRITDFRDDGILNPKLGIHVSLLLLAFLSPAFAYNVIFSSTTVPPGQTLRVEMDQVSPHSHYRIYFRQKIYPVFAIGPNVQRALIGIPLGLTPRTYKLQIKHLAGNPPRWKEPKDFSIIVSSITYPIENITLPPAKMALFKYEARETRLIYKALHVIVPEQSWEGEFSPPVEGKKVGEFGVSRLANHKPYEFHKGVDLEAPEGTPIRAANSGRVEIASAFKLHGRTVIVDHGQGVMSIYLHMKAIKVRPGQKVSKGDVLGYVGSTGLSTAPHVHWGVYVYGIPVDPQQWEETSF